jgi:hypothetical protein
MDFTLPKSLADLRERVSEFVRRDIVPFTASQKI